MPVWLERPNELFQTIPHAKSVVPRARKLRTDSTVELTAHDQAERTNLAAVGGDPDRERVLGTPRRILKTDVEMFSGLHQDPARHLRVKLKERCEEIVFVRDIRFTSMCEHHLLPFSGVADLGFIPNGRVEGLSKLARVDEAAACRPQVQDRRTEEVANLIETELGSQRVAVVTRVNTPERVFAVSAILAVKR